MKWLRDEGVQTQKRNGAEQQPFDSLLPVQRSIMFSQAWFKSGWRGGLGNFRSRLPENGE